MLFRRLGLRVVGARPACRPRRDPGSRRISSTPPISTSMAVRISAPSVPICTAITVSNQIAVAASATPMTWRKTTIHVPGRGNAVASLGMAATTR